MSDSGGPERAGFPRLRSYHSLTALLIDGLSLLCAFGIFQSAQASCPSRVDRFADGDFEVVKRNDAEVSCEIDAKTKSFLKTRHAMKIPGCVLDLKMKAGKYVGHDEKEGELLSTIADGKECDLRPGEVVKLHLVDDNCCPVISEISQHSESGLQLQCLLEPKVQVVFSELDATSARLRCMVRHQWAIGAPPPNPPAEYIAQKLKPTESLGGMSTDLTMSFKYPKCWDWQEVKPRMESEQLYELLQPTVQCPKGQRGQKIAVLFQGIYQRPSVCNTKNFTMGGKTGEHILCGSIDNKEEIWVAQIKCGENYYGATYTLPGKSNAKKEWGTEKTLPKFFKDFVAGFKCSPDNLSYFRK